MRGVRARGLFVAARAACVRVLLAAVCVLALGYVPRASPMFGDGTTKVEDKLYDEYLVKANLLLRFPSYMTWPKECFEKDESPFVIGVLGKDPFGAKLDDAAKKAKYGKRSIVVRRITDAADAAKCQIVFLGRGELEHLDLVLDACRGKPVLIVGDSQEFAERGACIGLYLNDENKARFAIHIAAAKSGAVKISSEFLKLGTHVGEKESTK